MGSLIISDPTLRDGNHAASHKISLATIEEYCRHAESAGIDIVEVGHGNGLGASSLQLGQSAHSDQEILEVARQNLQKTRLGVQIIPGFGRLSDIESALTAGADVVRVASHCTEADTTQRYIEYVRKFGKTPYGVLMMAHMAEKERLLIEARKMASYGAEAIILMDSAGAFLPAHVREVMGYLVQNIALPFGFHAHNNLWMSVANSLEAANSGVKIIDATLGGYGAGAGNTPLEIIVPVLLKENYQLSVSLDKIFSLAQEEPKIFPNYKFSTDPDVIMGGLHGVFSGFSKPIKKISQSLNIDAHEVYKRLGELKVIAGQEDLIIEVAQEIKRENEKNSA